MTPDIDCKTCGKKYTVTCDWQQGRCPHHPSMISWYPEYYFRYFDLIELIKDWWHGRKK